MVTETTICTTPLLINTQVSTEPAVERRKELALKRKALFAKIPKGMCEILPGKLWLGSGRDARQKQKLLTMGITHIVNCAIEWKNHYPSSFMYLRGNIFDNDNQDLSVFFSEAFDFLDDAFKLPSSRVFVHCVVGKSRSAALVMAYLMRTEKMTLKQAYYHVKTFRPIVYPNDGFMQQLMDFERQIFGTSTSSMMWGEWKNQTKCALAPPLLPLDTLSTPSLHDQQRIDDLPTSTVPISPDDAEREVGKENVAMDSNTTITTTSTSNTSTTSNSNTNKYAEWVNNDSPRLAKCHRTELQQEALDTFVRTHITPELLQQGLHEVCGGVYDSDSMGQLLQWVHHGIRDSTSCAEGVRREGLSWRDVAHSIDESAKQWLRQQERATKDDITT